MTKGQVNMEFATIYKTQIMDFLKEDELDKIPSYLHALPSEIVDCHLKFKDDLVVAGLPFFRAVFEVLGAQIEIDNSWEGKNVSHDQLSFKLPFNIALSGERLALNLLQRASSIATFTKAMKDQAPNLEIIDTRKTTPGLRFLEKYAVQVGGGRNHRFSQTDIWMIKDNHKNYFGGVKQAVEFFKNIKGFYQPIVLEIHQMAEIEQGFDIGIKHFLLDNFSPGEIAEAVKLKQPGMTYEVSGGINFENIGSYQLEGVDCVSSGSLTYNAPHVDISLKINE